MAISKKQLEAFRQFLLSSGNLIDEEWFLSHASMKMDDVSKSVTLSIADVSEDEFAILKEAGE